MKPDAPPFEGNFMDVFNCERFAVDEERVHQLIIAGSL
jgi:hypothetical protein